MARLMELIMYIVMYSAMFAAGGYLLDLFLGTGDD